MTNEWSEFIAYTEKPTCFSSGKRDFSYLGRFSFKTITELDGLGRILTVIARGYLFHNKYGNILTDDPYSRIEYAKNALCAWCSIPEKVSDSAVNFSEFSNDFPELVTSKGEGWFYLHIKRIINFAKKNPSQLSKKSSDTVLSLSKCFTKMWKNKVKQMQIPPLALNTKGAWILRFDDIIADALELGALKAEEIQLPQSIKEKLENIDLNGVPYDVVSNLICFYIANKKDYTDWVQLPVANFDCYYQNTNFSKKWLSKIPDTILMREVSMGICRIKLII